MHKFPTQHEELALEPTEGALTTEKVLSRSIPWEALRGNFLTAREVELIQRYDKQSIHQKMEFLKQSGSEYPALFLKLVGSITKTETLQYVLTLIEEILVEDPSNASLFLSLKESSHAFSLAPFFKILSTDEPDWYLTSKVCHILALLIHKSPQVNQEEAKQLLLWIKSQLSKNDPLDLITPLTTLQTLLRKDEFRILYNNEQGLSSLVTLVKTQTSHFQVLYQTIFCLWLLSYNSAIAQNFGPSGAIPCLVNILKTIAKDKVVRMTIATLRNLVNFPQNNEQMVETNLLKEVEKLSQKKWADEDVVNDLQVLTEHLQQSVSELSSWDMYKQELYSGLGLDWSPVHRSERFWRENSLHFEDNQNKPLEYLLGYLTEPNSNPTTLAVACHDIGELVRFHPRGRALIQNLGGKQKIMKLMSEHRDPEVQKQSLLCLQKLMVQNWEYLTR